MSTKALQDEVSATGYRKDPRDWVTGGRKATLGQKTFLSTLAANFGERFEKAELDSMTVAQASNKIQEYLKREEDREKKLTAQQPSLPFQRPEDTPSGNEPADMEAWMLPLDNEA